MHEYLGSIYVYDGLDLLYDTDAFKSKYNWKFSNNGNETKLNRVRTVDYQHQLAIL